MENADAAQAAALVGALGSVLVLLVRRRLPLLTGFALVGAAEIVLALSLVPGSDIVRLVDSPARALLLAVAVLAVLVAGVVLARRPELVPVLVLVASPFRVPAELGDQEAFLLVPLYAVLAASVVALVARLLEGEEVAELPGVLAIPASLFVGWASLSLFWSKDVEAGTVELLFFLFPFVVLVGVVARAPLAPWLPRALATAFVVLGCVFAAVGLSQLFTGELPFARDIEVGNAYSSYTRTTSLFADPSIYGRELVLALVVLGTVLLASRVNLWLAAAAMSLLWAGLFFTYSQSSMLALIAGVTLLGLLTLSRRGRLTLVAVAVAIVLAGAAFVVATESDRSLRRLTSGRSTLVENTAQVFSEHPLVGVGIGGQPRATQELQGARRVERRNASHTTPLTVAAELGVVGLAVYVTFLAGAVALLASVARRQRGLGIGLGVAFVVLVVHSLVYSGFFENPLTWGVLAVAAAAVSAGEQLHELAPAGEPAPAPPGRPSAGAARTAPAGRSRWQT